jgi:curved DNA-binding protein CbpA
MQNVPDPYRLLGVGRDASLDQIKAAHRRLAKRYHPDAPDGNRSQFLAVQEAYQLLADPLRRRQWDARHAAGPVRADDQPGRVRPRPANGQRSPGARYADGQAPRTWSARGVPWWEDGESTRARRPPGRQRPDASADDDSGQRASTGRFSGAAPSASAPGSRQRTTDAGSRQQRTTDPGSRQRRTTDAAGGSAHAKARRSDSGKESGAADRPAGRRERGGRPAPGTESADFDVYSRSSGAAWSSAARAYFRRGVDDLPRGRAPWATRPRPRRSGEGTTAGGDSATANSGQPGASSAWARAADAGQERDAPRPSADAGQTRSTWEHAARRPVAAEPSVAGPSLGTAPRFTSQGPHVGLARARRWAIEGRGHWPSLFQRLVFAVAGWLPPALALAYASGNVSGCDRAAVSCPPNFELIQLAAVTGLLGVLLILPRAAYLAAAGSAGLAFTAALLVIVYSVVGVAQPLPPPFALLTLALWLGGYVIGAFAAASDWPVPRPWSHDAWLNGQRGRAPSLGVARRVSRSRLSGR